MADKPKLSSRRVHSFDSSTWIEMDVDNYKVRSLAPFVKFRGTGIPWEHAEALDDSTERIVKSSRTRKVIKLSAGHFGSPVEVYVKRYNYNSWIRQLLRAGRKSRAREEFDLGWKLLEKGIRTPRPVWLAEAKGPIAPYSLSVTEALPEVESALERWLRCETESERSDLLIALGQFTGRIHDIGFYHDDFKAGHLLLFPHRPSHPDSIYLIDLLGGLFPTIFSKLRRAKNLYQIIRSFLPKRYEVGFTREHRDIFLLAYSSGNQDEAKNWSRWVDRIGRLKGRKLQ
jgi:tRNA A-37 threonylcarbamoyl transferase component Bud32